MEKLLQLLLLLSLLNYTILPLNISKNIVLCLDQNHIAIENKDHSCCSDSHHNSDSKVKDNSHIKHCFDLSINSIDCNIDKTKITFKFITFIDNIKNFPPIFFLQSYNFLKLNKIRPPPKLFYKKIPIFIKTKSFLS